MGRGEGSSGDGGLALAGEASSPAVASVAGGRVAARVAAGGGSRGRLGSSTSRAGGASGKANGWGNGRAAGESVKFGKPGSPVLSGYLARPNFSAASGAGRHGIVLAHGFPEAGQRASAPSYGYPQLATRLAAETGAVVLTFDFRGMGASEGDFSLDGWRADLAAGMGTLRAVPGVEEIWLVGFAA
ncbi:MAG TPA: hypothetical protein VEJ84_11885, partial [Acidimicrobiales bacterium]|nr:hypothetical protein [Acidimicrobiales bacterium]